MDQQERDLREHMCRVGKLMYQNDYVDATGGNLSARLGQGRILVSPSGLATGFMEPEQMLIVNLAGVRVNLPNDGNKNLRPTSESPMHLECYRQLNDVNGVVHAHPLTAVGFDLGGFRFSTMHHS